MLAVFASTCLWIILSKVGAVSKITLATFDFSKHLTIKYFPYYTRHHVVKTAYKISSIVDNTNDPTLEAILEKTKFWNWMKKASQIDYVPTRVFEENACMLIFCAIILTFLCRQISPLP